jgi:TP901 family phage tail tape measure protein
MAETAKLNVTFTADTKDFERGVDRVNKGLDNTKQKSESAFNRVGSDMRKMGGNLLKLAIPLDGLFVVAIKSAVDFDEQMTNIASVMGLTKKQTSKMADELMALSKTSKFSGTQLATAMYDVVGGVADASKHMDILAASTALAEANNSDLTASNKALISTFNAYAIQGVEVNRISDVMTQTIKQGVGTMDELAAVFAKTAGLAAPLGIDIEELGLLFADMSTKGVTFSQAGTQIEAALGQLLNPTKELETAFAQMGMTQADVLKMLEEQGLTAVIREMTDAGVDLTQVFGNKEALLGVLAIAGMDSTALETFTKNATGATDATRALAREAIQFKIDSIMSDFSDLAVVIGGALLPVVGDLVTDFSPLVQTFADFAKANPDTIKQVASLAIGLTGLGLVMYPLSLVVSGLGAALTIVKTGLQAVGIAGLIATGPLGAVALGVLLGISVFKQFETTLTEWGQSYIENWGIVLDAAQTSSDQLTAIVWKGLADMTNNEFFTSIRVAFEDLFSGISSRSISELQKVSDYILSIGDAIARVLADTGMVTIPGVSPDIAPTQLPQRNIPGLPTNITPSRPTPPRPQSRQPQRQIPMRRAVGGSIFANKPYLVGEKGPEIFSSRIGGMITPNRKVGDTRQVVITGNVNVYGVQDVNSLYDQLEIIGRRRGA